MTTEPLTWVRAKRPLIGIKLRKPKSITRKMIDRWDVCFEGITWFNLVCTPAGRFPLTGEFVDQAFSKPTYEVRFKTVWFSWLAIRVFSDLSKQTTDKPLANRVLNAKLNEFQSAVTRVGLKELPYGLLMIEQAQLGHLFIQSIDDL
jgi:hypothetical protein